jgi:hypothetical protein
MNLSPQQLALALGGEASGDEVRAPGPGHSVRDRSLSVKVGSHLPDGFVVFSHAGDDEMVCRDHVRERAGLPRWEPAKSAAIDHIARMQDRAKIPQGSESSSKPAGYVYQQADGSPYLRVNRTARKGFWQEQWNGAGWIKGAPKAKIPYRLPELLTHCTASVLIVEGEKDADNLISASFVATTNSGGAGKWTSDLNQHFTNRDVYILPDNDEAGVTHAQQVAASLNGVARSIRVVMLPDLPHGRGHASGAYRAAGRTSSVEIHPCSRSCICHRKHLSAASRAEKATGGSLDQNCVQSVRRERIDTPAASHLAASPRVVSCLVTAYARARDGPAERIYGMSHKPEGLDAAGRRINAQQERNVEVMWLLSAQSIRQSDRAAYG